MTGWEVVNGVAVRCVIDPAFMRALQELTRERGGGYIPRADIEKRAQRCQVIIPPLPPAVVIPPLPIIIPELP